LRLLERHLQAVELAVRKRLDAPKKRVSDVYFLATGLATVVTNGEPPIEVGMIGRNPMSDLLVVLDGVTERSMRLSCRSTAAAAA
jgi:hypothetical protein